MESSSLPAHFCIVPWVHAFIHQSGRVRPCCRADADYSFGSLKDASDFDAIWNSAEAKAMRLSMLSKEAPSQCRDCHLLEELGTWSPRVEANTSHAQELSRVRQTARDGSIAQTPTSLEIRFSNLCNLKCRTCDARFSTSWYRESREIHGVEPPREEIRPTHADEDLDRILARLVPGVKTLSFLGGEPLLHEQHYLLLERLIAEGRTDIALDYTTNFSKLTLGRFSALKLWQQFPKVRILASFDGVGPQGELLRKGLRWAEAEANFKRLRLMAPHAWFEIFPAVSVMNCFHLPDAIDRWIELGMLCTPSGFRVNFVKDPAYYSIRILNGEERGRLERRYVSYLGGLRERAPRRIHEIAERELGIILGWLAGGDQPDQRAAFRDAALALDRSRGESFVELFPELSSLLA